MNIAKLEVILKKRKITNYTLSKITGISQMQIGRLINKNVTNPRIDTIVKIASALDLTNDEFAKLCGYVNDK